VRDLILRAAGQHLFVVDGYSVAMFTPRICLGAILKPKPRSDAVFHPHKKTP